MAGIIVESEAYLGEKDAAAHSYGGKRSKRNASMWNDGGYSYVYLIYGMHHCFNVAAGREGEPVAVLIRALEPDEGLEQMRQNRKAAKKDRDLCSGPGKLCQALQINRGLDGVDLTRSDTLFIEQLHSRPLPANQIVATPRIGVDYAGEWARKPLRFFLRDNPNVSRAPFPKKRVD